MFYLLRSVMRHFVTNCGKAPRVFQNLSDFGIPLTAKDTVEGWPMGGFTLSLGKG